MDLVLIQVTSVSLHSISSMEKLKLLTMVGCSIVDDEGLHHLGKGCPSLQVINTFVKLF